MYGNLQILCQVYSRLSYVSDKYDNYIIVVKKRTKQKLCYQTEKESTSLFATGIIRKIAATGVKTAL